MPPLFNKKLGKELFVSAGDVQKNLDSGEWEWPAQVAIIGPHGGLYTVPREKLDVYFSRDFRIEADHEFINRRESAIRKKKVSGVEHRIAAGALSGLGSLSMGLSSLAYRGIRSLDPGGWEESGEYLRSVREEYPKTYGVAGVAGALATIPFSGPTGAAKLGGVGRVVRATPAGMAARITPGVEAAARRLATKRGKDVAGATTLGLALEGAAFGAGQGMSNISLRDDPFSIDAIVSEIPSSALYGAAGGIGIGVIGGGVRGALGKIKGRAERTATGTLAKMEMEAAGRNVADAKQVVRSLGPIKKQAISDFPNRLEVLTGSGAALRRQASSLLTEGRLSADAAEAMRALEAAEARFGRIADDLGLVKKRVAGAEDYMYGSKAAWKGKKVPERPGLVVDKKSAKALLEADDDTLKRLYSATREYETAATALHRSIDPTNGFAHIGEFISGAKNKDDVLNLLKTGKVEDFRDLPLTKKWGELYKDFDEQLSGFGDIDRMAMVSGPYKLELSELAHKGGVAELVENAMVAKKGPEALAVGPGAVRGAADAVAEKLAAQHGVEKTSALKAAEAAAGAFRQGAGYSLYTKFRTDAGMKGAIKGAMAARATGWVVDKATSPVLRMLGASTAPEAAAKAYAASKMKIAKRIDRILSSKRSVRQKLTVASSKVLASSSFGKKDKGYLDLWKGSKSELSRLQKLWVEKAAELSGAFGREMSTRKLIRDSIGDFILDDPLFADRLETSALMRLKFIMDAMPRATEIGAFGKDMFPPSDTEIAKWAGVIEVVENPHRLWDLVEADLATLEQVEAVRVVYPAIFAETQRALIERAAEIGRKLPYSRAIQLSHFFDITLHPFANPESMIMTQQTFLPSEAGGPPPPKLPSFSGQIEEKYGTAAQKLQK